MQFSGADLKDAVHNRGKPQVSALARQYRASERLGASPDRAARVPLASGEYRNNRGE